MNNQLRKSTWTVAAALLLGLWGRQLPGQQPITVASELVRLRTAEHLYRPQSYRLVQYSGFHRKGGNPDRMDCLYEEDGWRVVADHLGPGVVSRMWTTHGPTWSDIRIEVDGQVIYEGLATGFFGQDRIPFVRPLVEVRSRASQQTTAEKEQPGTKQWAISYVPIPFANRFRYLQREKVYANINVKALPADTTVESFLQVNWAELQDEIAKTASSWKRMEIHSPAEESCATLVKSVTIPAAQKQQPTEVEIATLDGPGIVRSVRVKTDAAPLDRDLVLQFRWDDEPSVAVRAPLGVALGSAEHRTLATGRDAQGWRICRLPMPFRQRARVSITSQAMEPQSCEVELVVEPVAELPRDVLYLRCFANEGQIAKGSEFAEPDLPLEDFYYRNGYTAFEHRGSGQVVAYMDLFNCQPELDEHVFIDDETRFPDNSWNGTGHEDLFDMAWGHAPLSCPMTSGGSERFEEVNVKLFWNDPMTFRTGIRFNWEWAFRFGVRPPRDARFASAVYWYGPPQPQSKR